MSGSANGNGHGYDRPRRTPPASALGDRLPPQNLEAEQGLLAGLIRDNETLHEVVPLLRAEDFYLDRHQILYRAIRDLYDQNRPIDGLILAEELRRRQEFDRVGGDEALFQILDSIPHAANTRYYAEIVREKSIGRKVIETANELLREGYSNAVTSDELLQSAERRIFQIAEDSATGETVELHEVIIQAMDRIARRSEERHPITGVATGFFELDDITCGFQGSQLVILAARPSMGKTALALNICETAAVEQQTGVLFVSLEMGQLELAERLLCARSRVDGQKLRKGQGLGTREMTLLGKAYEELKSAPIFIDDTPARNMVQVAANARRIKRRHGLGLIVVDYIQLVEPDTGESRDSRQEQIAKISRRLKTLARELSVPVIALSQLNRAVENREDRRPRMADLRECVTGETPVLLADGRRLPIRELVGTEPDVLAMSPEGQIIRSRSDKVWCVGRRPVYEIRLASGRTLRATARHRLLGAGGWTRVGDLTVGDRVAIARRLPEPTDPVRWPEEHLVLLGHMIGDGSYLTHRPLRYTTASESNSEAVSRAASSFGATVHRHAGRGRWHQLVISGNGNRWHPAGVNLWLRGLGIFGQRSREKRIPPEVFRLADDQVALLLRHLWATDGCIWLRGEASRGAPSVYFATSSPGLASDVAALLLRLGIVARIRRVVAGGAVYPVYQVVVSGARDQSRFLERVGAFGERIRSARKLAEYLVTRGASTNVDTLPREPFDRVRRSMRGAGISIRRMAALRGTSCGGMSHFRFAPSRRTIASYAEILDDAEPRRQATSDLFWDVVESVDPQGEEEVFDLTVPGPASWLADGIVSHNSGAIEQDADLVLLLHRPEYYDATDQPGIAELIVAKNRNGRTDSVKLTFLKNFMRFENLAAVNDPMIDGGTF